MTVWAALILAAASASGLPAIDLHNPMTWTRATSLAFGCALERAYGSTDPRFGCGAKPRPQGDPCIDTAAWQEGPAFPVARSASVHPLADDIELTWEHGQLQNVSLSLPKKSLSPRAARALFPEPSKDRYGFGNVWSVDVQDCAKERWCVLIIGFDHMGAGDVDCSEVASGGKAAKPASIETGSP